MTKNAQTKTGTRKKAATGAAKTAVATGSAFEQIKEQFKSFESMENYMKKGQIPFEKLAQEATSAGKENLEVLVKSGTIMTKGLEDIIKTCVSISQATSEKNAQAFKAIMGCKTLNEFTEAQNLVVQQNFDDFLSSMTKLSELGTKVATDALEPINDHVSRSIKKAGDAIAA